MEIRSAYDGSRIEEKIGGGESMTRQSFADESDINNIVERYARGGQIPLTDSDAQYGDVSEVYDYKSALDFMFSAKQQLAGLPEKAREQIAADPVEYWRLLDAAENRDGLVELGLLEPLPVEPVDVVEPVVEPPVVPVVPEA